MSDLMRPDRSIIWPGVAGRDEHGILWSDDGRIYVNDHATGGVLFGRLGPGWCVEQSSGFFRVFHIAKQDRTFRGRSLAEASLKSISERS